MNDQVKQGIISILVDYFDGKKSHLAAAAVAISGASWLLFSALSYFGGMDPVFATGLQKIAEGAGWVSAGLWGAFIRLALSKAEK